MDKRQQEYVATVPSSMSGIFERAFGGSPSRANAIKAKCLACTNFQRDEVRECTVVTCPLHLVRPFRAKPEKSETHSEIDEHDPDLDDQVAADDDEL